MTFKQVAFKNFLGQIKKYLSFYLCSAFCILFFFIYSTIIFNDNITNSNEAEAINYVMGVTIIAISLFSIFFINYAHKTFIRGRNKEFGVYMTLGMNSKELVRLVLFENVLIAGAALITGIVIGMLFSRLFQMILLDMLDITTIEYSLDYRAFLVTIVAFVIVFALNFLFTARKLSKCDIQTIILDDRKSDIKRYTKRNLVFGIVGLLIMVAAFVLLMVIAKDSELSSNPLMFVTYMLVAFIGVFLTIAHGGIYLIHQFKKSRFYLKNILFLTQLEYKYNQNNKIMFVLAILSTMTIFLVASPYSLLNLCETIVEDQGKAHIEFVVDENVHENYESVLAGTLDVGEIQEQSLLPMMLVDSKDENLTGKIPVINAENYNRYASTPIDVEKGSIYNLIYDWVPSNGGYTKGAEYTFSYQGEERHYTVAFSGNGTFVAQSYPSTTLLVMNDADYKELKQTAGSEDSFMYCLVNLKDWKSNIDAINSVEQQLYMEGYPVETVAAQYDGLKKGYSVFLFVTSILGIMFFIAGGSVLYFRQYSELSETKKTFGQLFKIGMSYKETKSIVAKQLLVIFYVPAVFGCYLGLSLIYLTTHLLGGQGFVEEFMKNASIIVIIYLISQSIFYYITKRKYMNVLNA